MKNTYQPNPDFLDYTNSTGSTITGGTLVQVGSLHGVVVADIPASATGVLSLKGIYTLPKLVAAAGDATTNGGPVYFSSGSVSGSDSSATRKLVGHSIGVFAQASATCIVRLFN